MATVTANDATITEPRLRGLGSVYQRGCVWWIAYWWRGEKIRESSRSAKKPDAVRLLKRRIQEIGKGRFINPRAEERVRMTDLFDIVVTDYKNNARRSLATLEDRLIPLKAAFGLVERSTLTRPASSSTRRLAWRRSGGATRWWRRRP